MSRAAIKSQFEALLEDSNCDNVLLEHRLALELAQRGLVERICPLYIGDIDATTSPHPTYSHFFLSGHCAPSPLSTAVVKQVEDKLKEHLERQALGTPFRDGMSVKEVFETIGRGMGGFVEGNEALDAILEKRAEEICTAVRLLKKVEGGGSGGGGGVSGVVGGSGEGGRGGQHDLLQQLLQDAYARADAEKTARLAEQAAREEERRAKEVALQAFDVERAAKEAEQQAREAERIAREAAEQQIEHLRAELALLKLASP